MYHDEIFENALKDVKEESYKALKDEISTMEATIDKFLSLFLRNMDFCYIFNKTLQDLHYSLNKHSKIPSEYVG